MGKCPNIYVYVCVCVLSFSLLHITDCNVYPLISSCLKNHVNSLNKPLM